MRSEGWRSAILVIQTYRDNSFSHMLSIYRYISGRIENVLD